MIYLFTTLVGLLSSENFKKSIFYSNNSTFKMIEFILFSIFVWSYSQVIPSHLVTKTLIDFFKSSSFDKKVVKLDSSKQIEELKSFYYLFTNYSYFLNSSFLHVLGS